MTSRIRAFPILITWIRRKYEGACAKYETTDPLTGMPWQVDFGSAIFGRVGARMTKRGPALPAMLSFRATFPMAQRPLSLECRWMSPSGALVPRSAAPTRLGRCAAIPDDQLQLGARLAGRLMAMIRGTKMSFGRAGGMEKQIVAEDPR